MKDRYNVDRAHNRPDAPFCFYPETALRLNRDGGGETLAVTDSSRSQLQALLADFLVGNGQTLRLTWGKEKGKRRHIVLRREDGRFLMVWIREDKETAEFHAANRWTYMDVEGKKYPKDTSNRHVANFQTAP